MEIRAMQEKYAGLTDRQLKAAIRNLERKRGKVIDDFASSLLSLLAPEPVPEPGEKTKGTEDK